MQLSLQDFADLGGDLYFYVGAVEMSRMLDDARKKVQMDGRITKGSIYLYLFNHYPACKFDNIVK